MAKRVNIIDCQNKLKFVKAIKENTNKSLLEAKNIADAVVKLTLKNGEYKTVCGILLLNESSITEEQWEAIAQDMEKDKDFKWKYV